MVEFIPALILASSATYLYLKSNRNFMVSYFYQLAVILVCIFSCKIFRALSIIHTHQKAHLKVSIATHF